MAKTAVRAVKAAPKVATVRGNGRNTFTTWGGLWGIPQIGKPTDPKDLRHYMRVRAQSDRTFLPVQGGANGGLLHQYLVELARQKRAIMMERGHTYLCLVQTGNRRRTIQELRRVAAVTEGPKRTEVA